MSLLKQKPTRIDVNNAVETNEYQSLVRENTDSDNSTITCTKSLYIFGLKLKYLIKMVSIFIIVFICILKCNDNINTFQLNSYTYYD